MLTNSSNSSETTRPTVEKDKQNGDWVPSDKVPSTYVRLTGTAERPDLEGKKVLRRCKSCHWWKNPFPRVTKRRRNQQGCQTNYHADPDKKGTPPDFRCKRYLHREHREIVTVLNQQLTIPQLRVLEVLARPLLKILDEVSEVSVKTAVDWLLSQHPRVIKEVVGPTVSQFTRVRKESFKIPLKCWYTITPREGEPFKGFALSMTSKGVDFLPSLEAGREEEASYVVPYDLFETMCTPLEKKEKPAEIVEED